MIYIGKKHSSLDSWPKTLNQNISIEDMILIIWYKEAIK